jgi:dCTP deaminase
MPVLTHPEIKRAIKEGLIKITPLDVSQIGPGSVDLTLGNEFRVFRKQLKPYHIRNHSNFEDVSEAVAIKNRDYIIINPGEMIMGITKERITLAENVCGWLEGRSRFARFGLAVHVTAGFMQPGIDNHQVLEIVNLGLTPLALYPGTKICQFIFEKCEGKAKYKGRFQKQVKP